MDKQEITVEMKVAIINELTRLKKKLEADVGDEVRKGNIAYGHQRLQSWLKVFSRFIQNHLPNEIKEIKNLPSDFSDRSYNYSEPKYDIYRRTCGNQWDAYIDSTVVDIKNHEYDFTPLHKEVKQEKTTPKVKSNKVFIVHGHNNEVKERTARFIEKLGFEPIILHEQASGGSTTIIEKILEYAKTTDFAIVLYTADDVGGIKKTEPCDLKARARQNVVFEHGLLIGLLGRENVVPLVADDIEIPNDISGVVYVRDDWKTKIALEMKKAGYDVDMNKLY
jgi:predicted nucleotide-binding protein